MTSRRRTTIMASCCLAISLVASVFLLQHIDQLRPKSTIEDVLYIDSPTMVKRASLGFNGLMACIYWTRTVQYFGHRHFMREQSYNELAPLLEITTALDPHMFPAYEFGASFLAPQPPNGAGEPERAIKLMEYGIEHNPNDWHLYYDLGFIYYTELHDYAKASEVFARGSLVPDAHPFMKVLAAQTAEHAGDLSTARMLWTATYQTSNEKSIRKNAQEHLRSIRVDEDVIKLQDAVDLFARTNGRLPSGMPELAAANLLPGLPADPEGVPYILTPGGHIMVGDPENFPFITQGVPPGYKAPPPKFHTGE
jgi:tetratricopeptide (TPR) repeat protein